MSTQQSVRLMLRCQGSHICIAQDSCMEQLKNKHGTDATTHPLATLESFDQNSQKLDGSKWLSKPESWKRDQLRGEPEEKAIYVANIKVSVSFLKVFVFFSFFSWKSLPATFGEAPCHYGSSLHTDWLSAVWPCKNSFNTWVFPQVTLTFHRLLKWAHFRWLTSNNKFTVPGIRRDTQSLFSTSNPCINRWYE